MKANKTMGGQAVPNHRRRKGKKVVTLIQLHTIKPLNNKQLNDRNHHIPIDTNTEC
jgi:hypothetical protein